MFRYIFGKVTEQGSNYIVLECNNIGYLIYVSNPYAYELEKEYKVKIIDTAGQEKYQDIVNKCIELDYNFTTVPEESSEVIINEIPTIYLKQDWEIVEVYEWENINKRLLS